LALSYPWIGGWVCDRELTNLSPVSHPFIFFYLHYYLPIYLYILIYNCFTRCTMKKLYNFRLETNLISQVDKIASNRTSFVNDALQVALQDDLQSKDNVNTNNHQYNLDYIQHLENEIVFLRETQRQMNARVFLLPETNNENEKVVRNVVLEGDFTSGNDNGRKKAQNSARALKINPQRNVKTNNKAKRAKKGKYANPGAKKPYSGVRHIKKKGWWARTFGF